MKALLRKDLPWIALFLVGGTVGFVLALCAWSFVNSFVVGPGSRDELFHVAWACGMGLGVAAFTFDELLGTRELLTQRPVSVAAVVGARLVGCTLVLAGWFVLAPIAAYLVLALFDSSWQWGHWQEFPAIWANMTPAISGCAIGALAAQLPWPWWMRLCSLGALFLLTFSTIFWLERATPRDATAWPLFVGGHLAVAACATALLWLGRGSRRDGDRPVAARTRRVVLISMLAVGACFASLGLHVLEGNSLQRLRGVYPHVVRDEGRYALAVRPDYRMHWQEVDARHVPTGAVLSQANGLDRGIRGFSDDFVRIEPPYSDTASTSGWDPHGQVFVSADGEAWWKERDGSLQRVSMSASEPLFPRGTRADTWGCGERGENAIVLYHRGSNRVWRFDPETATFNGLSGPPGDEIAGRSYGNGSDFDPIETPGPVPWSGETGLRGDRFLWLLRGETWHKIGRRKADARASAVDKETAVLDDDLLGFTVVVVPREGRPPFRHEFTPRTATERWYASLAIALAVARPPLLQVVAGVLPRSGDPRVRRPLECLLDPLVATGPRWWLVASSIALGAACAWFVARRLRRLGADRATTRFWVLATALLGPFGALASVLAERPRAWADRRVRGPAPAPRIVTPSVPETAA